MIGVSFKQLYLRDLNRLKVEIEQYSTNQKLWIIESDIKNSGGNLCLHLIGNLKTYIGHGLAGIDYIRKRDLEFSAKNIDKKDLLKEIDECIYFFDFALDSIKDEEMNNPFPIQIWDQPQSIIYTIAKLHAHLNYHLGQINYHRRILDN